MPLIRRQSGEEQHFRSSADCLRIRDLLLLSPYLVYRGTLGGVFYEFLHVGSIVSQVTRIIY